MIGFVWLNPRGPGMTKNTCLAAAQPGSLHGPVTVPNLTQEPTAFAFCLSRREATGFQGEAASQRRHWKPTHKLVPHSPISAASLLTLLLLLPPPLFVPWLHHITVHAKETVESNFLHLITICFYFPGAAVRAGVSDS